MTNFAGFILIGGKSSRMGEDKFALVLNGKTFLEIAFETLQKVGVEQVSAVVNKTESTGADGLTLIRDIYANRGALGGIHSALTHSKGDWTIILACDYPFVTVDLIKFLMKISESENEFEAFAPIQADGKIQPLCAVYKTEICRKILSEMLENTNEKYSVRDFLNRIETRYIEFSEIADLPSSANFFFNVNTPEDFRLAAKKASVEILKMTPNDVGRVVEIQLACGLEGWSAEDYGREIYRSNSFNVTAKLNGETVGYLIGRFIQAESCAELYNIGVDPRFRRKMVGNAMLEEFIEFCVSENLQNIYLEVRESNEMAIRFYLKNNFTVIGKRKNFYSNPVEDAILMELKL